MTRFWVMLQHPLSQAALVEDGEIVMSIPPHPPQTRQRQIGPIGEYQGQLVLGLPGSFQVWTADGERCLVDSFHPLIYGAHSVVEWRGNILVCASGLDLFFLMDATGNVKWEWWAADAGLCEKNPWFMRDATWTTRLLSGRQYVVPDSCHFNSIFVEGESILTSAMCKHAIMRLWPGEQRHEIVTTVESKGIHSPIYHDGRLIYGTHRGVMCNDRHMLCDKEWIKQIRIVPDGFLLSCEDGVHLTDFDLSIVQSFPLPRPFQTAFWEHTA